VKLIFGKESWRDGIDGNGDRGGELADETSDSRTDIRKSG
jgi:hypothetical protein